MRLQGTNKISKEMLENCLSKADNVRERDATARAGINV